MNKKDEIKNRIDLINKGEVPEGYKCCWGYFYPANWDIKKLKDLFNKVKTKNTNNSVLPVLTNSATQGVILQDEYFDREIVNDDNTDGYYIVEDGDFMYNPRISSNAPAGPINRNHLGISGIASPLYTIFRAKEDENIAFVENYFNSSYWHRYMKSVSNQGARHDRLNLTDDDFMGMPIPQPSKQEQEKIAEILSCCDKVIELKENLQNAKRKQKQYIMQKLFTNNIGKPYILGELGTTYTGLSGKNKNDFGFGSKFIPYTNIFANTFVNTKKLEFVNIKEGESQNKVKYGDIFFTTSSECPEEVGMASVLLENVENLYLNSFCFGYRLNNFDILLPEYAGYFFRNNYFRSILNKLAQGMTRFNLSKNELMKETVFIPDIKVQKLYIKVFNDINKEIALLEQELEQYKQLKKALSQLLLTGIVRTME